MSRTKKYGEETELYARRVPRSKIVLISNMIENFLQETYSVHSEAVPAKSKKSVVRITQGVTKAVPKGVADSKKTNPSGCDCYIGPSGLFVRVGNCEKERKKHKFE
jgi:hypothetical protein